MPIDPERLSALFSEHEQPLRRFVLGVLRDRAAAEDVVQMTFAKAMESGGPVEPAALKSWLYRVAMNEAISWRRREGAGRRAVENLGQREQPPDAMPEASLVRQETIAQVRRALETLPPSQRLVVDARIYRNLKFVQIAAETQSPLPTVITHMRRALEALRKQLKRPE